MANVASQSLEELECLVMLVGWWITGLKGKHARDDACGRPTRETTPTTAEVQVPEQPSRHASNSKPSEHEFHDTTLLRAMNS